MRLLEPHIQGTTILTKPFYLKLFDGFLKNFRFKFAKTRFLVTKSKFALFLKISILEVNSI